MKHGPRGKSEKQRPREADRSRRRFLSTVVIGAAYTACGKGGMPGDPRGLGGSGGSGMAAGGRGGRGGAGVPGGSPGTTPGSGGAGGSSQPSQPQPGKQDAGAAEASGSDTAPDTGQEAPAPSGRKRASDRVALGRTGLMVSRLAMGSGTHGSGGTSEQTRLGVQAYARLLVQSYHEQGMNFWETADGYGSHPHVGEAIRQVGRDKVVVLTKSKANTAAEMQADLDRFRRELGVEQIDVVLLHAVTDGNWTQSLAGAMDVLSMAKERGIIRAHGISCHSLSALRLAARTPWVDVDLARINPARIQMDADPATVISVLREMKAAGKGVVGMKILGVGALANRMETAIRHAVGLDAIDAFTIGFNSYTQLQQVAAQIEQAST
jgi:aryl-alcohol dehydrogenase-like predicted oxidoreductase